MDHLSKSTYTQFWIQRELPPWLLVNFKIYIHEDPCLPLLIVTTANTLILFKLTFSFKKKHQKNRCSFRLVISGGLDNFHLCEGGNLLTEVKKWNNGWNKEKNCHWNRINFTATRNGQFFLQNNNKKQTMQNTFNNHFYSITMRCRTHGIALIKITFVLTDKWCCHDKSCENFGR